MPVQVHFSWEATEATVVNSLADAIMEVTETVSTIKAHGLKIIKGSDAVHHPVHRQQNRLDRPGQKSAR